MHCFTMAAFMTPNPRVNDKVLFGLFALAFAVFWLGVIGYLSYSPPIDTAEQLTWSRYADWGYYKHPPLTTLLLIPFVRLLGVHEWVPGLLGATLTLGSFYVLWDWIRGVLGERTAWIALLLLTCVSTYAYRLHYYNHNIILLATYLLAARLYWNVVQKGRLRDWAWAGAALGLAAMTKYQAILILPALVIVTVQLGLLKRPGALQGLVVAALCGLLVLSPHLVWLVQHDYLPFTYVQTTSLEAGAHGWAQVLHVLNWLLNQVQRVLSIGLLVIFLWVWGKWFKPVQAPVVTKPAPAPLAYYLAVLGWTPLVCTLLLGLFKGMHLQPHWMTPFFPLWVASWVCQGAAMRWFAKFAMWRIVVVYLMIQLLLAYISWGTSVKGGYWGGKRYNRDFQSQQAANRLQDLTRADFPKGIPIVLGLSNIADVISLRLPNRPAVLVEGKLLYSPWLQAGQLHEQGALLVAQNLDEVAPLLQSAGVEAKDCALRTLPEFGLHWCVIKAGTPVTSR